MLREIVSTRQFALADLILVSLSSILWIAMPRIGILPVVLLALTPWCIRLLAGVFPFRRTPLDVPVLIFLCTAWVGYWVAYDQETAWRKVWLIVLAALLFYAVAGQPKKNLAWLCILFLSIGVSVSIYFLLTYDFIAFPRKLEIANQIGRWIMRVRPGVGWNSIHPNYASGVAAITTLFGAYPAIEVAKQRNRFSALILASLALAVALTLVTVFLATSRGVLFALVSAMGLWTLWRLADSKTLRLGLRREMLFPSLTLLYVAAVVLFLLAGPSNASGDIAQNGSFGSGSRGELFDRSLYLVSDFPFTGGGLNSFAGLYSYYILGIPFLNVINSHNLFVDVSLEQGLLGGLAYFLIFLTSFWCTARAVSRTEIPQLRLFGWLTLFALTIAFVHGMVDDYLYNDHGTVLSLVLAGLFVPMHPNLTRTASRSTYRIRALAALMPVFAMIFIGSQIRGAWYANLGALEMAKAELVGFPTGHWTEASILPTWESAEASLRASLRADSANRTANHRLGLITMLRGDFRSAAVYLEVAHQQAPRHRGIIKSLGYCYVWLGELEKAQTFLGEIPEAERELGNYVWWWRDQGREDLSANASLMLSSLSSAAKQ